MQITIRQVAAQPLWLAKLSAFLHDAARTDPFTYDLATRTFQLPLARIGYEFRQKRPWLGFLTQWRMPLVSATLTLKPVNLHPSAEELATPGEMDQLTAIVMPDPTRIELHTREGVVQLGCTDNTALTLADTASPETRLAVSDFGRLIIPDALIEDLVRTQVV